MTRVPLPDSFLARPFAHRALHDREAGRPENSRAAVAAAVAAGYGIEIDLQPSADGVAMVFHDYDLGRLTAGTGPVSAHTSGALGRLPLAGGDGEGVPRLSEILALVAGNVPVLVEIKDQDGAMGPAVGALEAAIAADLAGYDGPVAVMSFNPHSVAAMAAAAPGLPRGLTTCAFAAEHWPTLPAAVRDRLRGIPDYDRTGAAFVSHRHTDLAAPRVAELKRAGAAILCWTVRSPADETAARAVADQITFEGYPA